ncbi:hypothetical protein [uncultured Chryseobacterium sp.]|uniref:hypothetical protein n=1 Tax=uncultured Chryseobacterium sp. TaxID=259322 RepID=UPI003748B841
MKKSLFISTLLLGITTSAQIGINTPNPQATLHIDGAKDNPNTGLPSTTQEANDFAVTSTGNVGIGTISPTTKFHINSTSSNAVRIVDTTEGPGKVLTSDSSGNARWAPPGSTFAVKGTIPNTGATTVATIEDTNLAGIQRIANSGMSITLTPGKYQVNFTLWCAADGSNYGGTSNAGFASVFLSSNPSTPIAPVYITSIKSVIIPRLYNAASNLGDYYGSGNIAVSVSSTTTLYLWVYMSNENWSSTSNRNITFRYDNGNYGPYVQFYAIPFEVE